MADNNNTQIGMIVLVLAVFFLLNGLDMIRYEVFDMDQKLATLISFILIAVSVYLLAKK